MLLTLAAGIGFLLVACKKSGDIPSQGDMTVEINGMKWYGKMRTKGGNRITIAGDKYKTISGVEIPFEVLSLGLIPRTTSQQTLYPRDSLVTQNPDSARIYASFTTRQGDGDVGCDGFRVLTQDSANNWVRITRQENNYQKVWGEFSVTMVRTRGCAASPYAADTLRFRNGEFSARIN